MTNVLSAGTFADKHYKHNGFSSSITDSYTSPSTAPTGITWGEGTIPPPPVSKTSSDTGAGADAMSVSAAISESDVGSGADVNLDVPASLLKTDTGAGLGAISEQLSNRSETDTGTGVDALLELLKFIAKFSSDTGVGVDTILPLLAEIDRSDVGVGEGKLSSRLFGSSDVGAGTDTISQLLVELIRSEIGAGEDKINSRSLANFDLGIGMDARLALLAERSQSEAGAGLDRITSRFFSSPDLGIGIDAIVEIVDVLTEEGVSIEFGNFTQDFTRMVTRYGRTLLNINTKERFNSILRVLGGGKCLDDSRMMKCGDAIAYVLPTFKYRLGDRVTAVLGRGEWTIVAERRASRIGNLRVFRALGLERYTPGAPLTGIYDIALPIAVELVSSYGILNLPIAVELISSYEIAKNLIEREMSSKYDITKAPPQIIGERAIATGDMIDNYWNPWDDIDLSYYKIHRALNTGFTPSDANLVGVTGTNSFKHSNLSAATQYYFKVCAVTKLGVSGVYSAQFTATTA